MRENTHVTKVSFAEFPNPEKPGAVIVTGPHATNVQVLADVLAERARQDAKWGQQNHDDGTGPVIMPLASRWDSLHETDRAHYLAETFRRRCERRFSSSADGLGTWRDIFLEEVFEALAEDDPVKLRAELVQTVAVGVAWIEAIDRRTAAPDA